MMLRLGAATLTCLKSLQVKLSLPPIPVPVNALVDSGSSDCFIDFALISKYHLLCWKINPCPLALIDGTINHLVNHVMSLPIRLPCLYSFQIEFFVTKLEGTYPIVLGHNWSTQYNPLIDWRKGTIEFNPSEPMDQSTSSRPDLEPQNLPLAISLLSEKSPVHSAPGSCANSLSIWHLVENYPSEDWPSNNQTTPNKPQTSLVNTATFMSTCKSKGAISFQITSLPTVVTSLATQTGEADPEIPGVQGRLQHTKGQITPRTSTLWLSYTDRSRQDTSPRPYILPISTGTENPARVLGRKH